MGFSSGSLGLPGEDPAERQPTLRMVGNSSPRPAAHSSREAVGGAETATRSQGHAAHKGARKRTLPKALPPGPPCAPGRPLAASHSLRSPPREQRRPWSPEDRPAWGRNQECRKGQEDPARPKPLSPRRETGQGSRVLVLFGSDGAQTGAWHREGT